MNLKQAQASGDEQLVTRARTITSRAEEVRHHIHQIVSSGSFSKSRRSSEFLQYLADKTLSGELSELKERVIGVQLFGRDPSYDTGEDAIVRVTATDVRRRLKRFYDDAETDIRLELPTGSYIIELIEQANAPTQAETTPAPEQPVETVGLKPQPSSKLRVILFAAAILVVLGLSLGFYRYHTLAAKSDRLPWSVMLPGQGKLKVVFSDPDIATLQGIIGGKISLSDYAGHRHVPPQQLLDHPSNVVERLFKGYNVPIIDTDFALSIKNILPSSQLTTYRARSLQAQDFKTEDNFVLLGSPFSNPWVELFQDRLDFYFQYDPAQHGEVIYNRHPEHGESALYAPTAPGWGTGQAYAVIGLLANQNQTGHVLILAGSNAVATEAAYRLGADEDSLARVLQEHGMNVYDQNLQFEILLRVNTMASSLKNFDVVACHRLSDASVN